MYYWITMSLFYDDFKVLISFLIIMFLISAQSEYLLYFVCVDLSVFTGDAGPDGPFEVSFSSFTSGSLDCKGMSS